MVIVLKQRKTCHTIVHLQAERPQPNNLQHNHKIQPINLPTLVGLQREWGHIPYGVQLELLASYGILHNYVKNDSIYVMTLSI